MPTVPAPAQPTRYRVVIHLEVQKQAVGDYGWKSVTEHKQEVTVPDSWAYSPHAYLRSEINDILNTRFPVTPVMPPLPQPLPGAGDPHGRE